MSGNHHELLLKNIPLSALSAIVPIAPIIVCLPRVTSSALPDERSHVRPPAIKAKRASEPTRPKMNSDIIKTTLTMSFKV